MIIDKNIKKEKHIFEHLKNNLKEKIKLYRWKQLKEHLINNRNWIIIEKIIEKEIETYGIQSFS